MCEEIMCRTGRDTRPTGDGLCGGEAQSRDITRRTPRTDIWRYPWNGSNCVIVSLLGQRFEFHRYREGITRRNLTTFITYYRDVVRDEEEQDIRGNAALAWLADMSSGARAPNRSSGFRQMRRAAADAESAFSAHDLGGAIRSIRNGLVYLNVARHQWRTYVERHGEGAESNVALVRNTRDISLAVSTTVLTGGMSTGTTALIAGGTAALTTGFEEVGVTGFGRYGVINWQRIGVDALTAVVVELTGGLASKMGKAFLKRLGPMLRQCDLVGAFESTIVQRFPNLSAQQRSDFLATLGRQARSGQSGDLNLSMLGVDGNSFRSIVISVITDTFQRMPRNILQSLMTSVWDDINQVQLQSNPMSAGEFADKVIDKIISSHTSISRTIVTALLASLQRR